MGSRTLARAKVPLTFTSHLPRPAFRDLPHTHHTGLKRRSLEMAVAHAEASQANGAEAARAAIFCSCFDVTAATKALKELAAAWAHNWHLS